MSIAYFNGIDWIQDTNQEDQTIPVTGITLTPNNLNVAMNVTATRQVTAAVTPNNATDPSITWSSNNTSIATVNQSGLVTFVNVGTVNIIATSNSNPTVQGSATFVVKRDIISCSISGATGGLTVGSTRTLTAVLNPTTATSPTYQWVSSAPSVASVTTGSSTCVVTARSTGTAVITLTVTVII